MSDADCHFVGGSGTLGPMDATLQLDYDQPAGGAVPQYSGNISALTARTATGRHFTQNFTYDGLDRLLSNRYVDHTTPSITDQYNTDYTYDRRGNILTLERYGRYALDDTNHDLGQIDRLGHSYVDNTNRSQSITDETDDAAAAGAGFIPHQRGDYQYSDLTGNLTYDPSRDLGIQYNHLNLPHTFTMEDGRQLRYLYTAGGVKLGETKLSPTGEVLGRRDYLGPVILRDGVMESVQHGTGRVIPGVGCLETVHVGSDVTGMESRRARTITADATVRPPDGNLYLGASRDVILQSGFRVESGARFQAEQITCYGPVGEWRFEYYLTDHLGNNRMGFADINGDNQIDAATEVLWENHYYAFGMEMEGAWQDGSTSASDNRFKYNGKELNPDLGLYAYGARYYDPTIGRFTGVDPIADQFPHVSTYNYAENDPIVNIDLHGLQKVNINVLGQLTAKNGQQIAVAGEAQLDIGNQNRVDIRLFRSEGRGISFSYSQSDGVGLAAAGFGPSSFDEAMFNADRPGGVVIPGVGLDIGLSVAADAVTPDSQEEANQLSPEEKQLNSQIRFILNTVGELNDQGLLTPLFDRDGSSSEGTNSDGENYTREFGSVYRGSIGDFEFTESGISFKGKVIISYTEQECIRNCDD